ncbi:MAG TPA: hypothetical protein VF950_25585 [Planctomycetota bacterium]
MPVDTLDPIAFVTDRRWTIPMVKCVKCGTAWTSSGLPFCPICDTRVEETAVFSKTPTPAVSYASSDGSARKASNGSAVLDVSPELRTAETRVLPQVRAADTAPVEAVLKPEPDLAPPAPTLPLDEAPDETRVLRIPQDESAILSTRSWAETLRAPARPMNGPLILGILAFVPALLLPLTLAFEGTRVLGILGFCMSGFSAPFAPIAWIAGVSLEKRRRDQGLRPERAVSIGRRLGQAATLLLVAEMTFALVGIAVLRLSGNFPPSFWSGF